MGLSSEYIGCSVTGRLADLIWPTSSGRESEAGAVTVPIDVSDAMRRGVVSLPHGWGHDRDGVRLGIARAHVMNLKI